jgi:hypothetical protein
MSSGFLRRLLALIGCLTEIEHGPTQYCYNNMAFSGRALTRPAWHEPKPKMWTGSRRSAFRGRSALLAFLEIDRQQRNVCRRDSADSAGLTQGGRLNLGEFLACLDS